MACTLFDQYVEAPEDLRPLEDQHRPAAIVPLLAKEHHSLYNDTVQRTTILADEETVDRLKRLASERGVSFATVVREALEDKARSFHPKPTSLGSGQSNMVDSAETAASRRQPPRSWR